MGLGAEGGSSQAGAGMVSLSGFGAWANRVTRLPGQ